MTRTILLFLLLLPGLCAKRPVDPDDQPIKPVYVHKTHFKDILERHPGAKELPERRGRNVIVVQLPDEEADAAATPAAPHSVAPPRPSKVKHTKYLSTFGLGQTYQDPDTGAWLLASPQLSATKRGWTMLGSRVDTVIKNIGNAHEVEQVFNDPATKKDPSVAITYPPLAYLHDETFAFQKDGLAWKLKLGSDGSEFTAEVPQRMGQQVFRFPFRDHLVGVKAAPDGSLVGNFSYVLARAITVGADHEVRPCGAWEVRNNELSFSCDDSAFPPEAFPYIIDPTNQFTRPGYADEVNVRDAVHSYYTIFGDGNAYGIGKGVFSMGSGWGRYNGEMFFRWDTSSLPDGNIVSGASMTLWGGGQGSGNGALVGSPVFPFNFYWYPASKWPIGVNGAANGGGVVYQDDANSVYAGYWGPQCACAGGYKTITFDSNFGQVSKTGYTSIRWKHLGAGFSSFYDFYVSGYSMDFAVKLDVTHAPPNTPPSTVSVSGIPANFHYGTWQAISATVSDPDGWANLSYWHLLINYGVDGGYACYFLFYPNSNSFYLLNDLGNAWGSGCTMGTGCTLSNGQCKVDAASSSFSNSGTTSTANLWVMFLPGALVRNPMNAYLYACDAADTGKVWGGAYQTGYVRTRPRLIVTQR